MKKAVFGNDIAYYNGENIRWIVDMPKAHLILEPTSSFERSDFKPIEKELTKLKAKHGIGELVLYVGVVAVDGKNLIIKPQKSLELSSPNLTLEEVKAFVLSQDWVYADACVC